MKTKLIASKTVLFVAFMMFFSCQKEDLSSPNNAGTTAKNSNITNKSTKKIYVSNVEQLYTAVNDPVNVGATIVLAPGTYLLSTDAAGTPRPNGGRIELQHDMSLLGQEGHREAVIIDVSGLPVTSQRLPVDPVAGQFKTGLIRMGDGSNAIEWMTLQNDPSHSIRSVINTDLITTPVTYIRIAHTIVKGGTIGINIQNRFTESNGRTVNAEIVDNEITGNTVLPLAAGIFIQNSWGGLLGGVIRVTMSGNYVHGNVFGLTAFNVETIKSTIEIKSNADRFENNALGLALVGGLSADPETFNQTDGNSVLFEAHGTAVRNNSGTPFPAGLLPDTGALGGISAHGAQLDPDAKVGYANNNRLEINLWGCPIENNVGAYQINAWGARSRIDSPLAAGTNNTATIHLYGLSKQATVNTFQSIPTEPAGTNKVTIFR